MANHSHHRLRRTGTSLAVALVAVISLSLLVSPIALAGGGPPLGKIYDCYGYGTTAPNYVSALELKTKAVYLVAPIRKGNRLSGAAVQGTYTIRGGQLSFRTGTYGQIHWYGKWVLRHRYTGSGADPAHIALFTPKHQEVLDCYPH